MLGTYQLWLMCLVIHFLLWVRCLWNKLQSSILYLVKLWFWRNSFFCIYGRQSRYVRRFLHIGQTELCVIRNGSKSPVSSSLPLSFGNLANDSVPVLSHTAYLSMLCIQSIACVLPEAYWSGNCWLYELVLSFPYLSFSRFYISGSQRQILVVSYLWDVNYLWPSWSRL